MDKFITIASIFVVLLFILVVILDVVNWYMFLYLGLLTLFGIINYAVIAYASSRNTNKPNKGGEMGIRSCFNRVNALLESQPGRYKLIWKKGETEKSQLKYLGDKNTPHRAFLSTDTEHKTVLVIYNIKDDFMAYYTNKLLPDEYNYPFSNYAINDKSRYYKDMLDRRNRRGDNRIVLEPGGQDYDYDSVLDEADIEGSDN